MCGIILIECKTGIKLCEVWPASASVSEGFVIICMYRCVVQSWGPSWEVLFVMNTNSISESPWHLVANRKNYRLLLAVHSGTDVGICARWANGEKANKQHFYSLTSSDASCLYLSQVFSTTVLVSNYFIFIFHMRGLNSKPDNQAFKSSKKSDKSIINKNRSVTNIVTTISLRCYEVLQVSSTCLTVWELLVLFWHQFIWVLSSTCNLHLIQWKIWLEPCLLFSLSLSRCVWQL